MATGLDKHNPFSNLFAMEVMAENAVLILAPGAEPIGKGHALILWSRMCNFILLDRLYKTFAAMAFGPSHPIPRTHCERSAIGTATPVSVSLLIFVIVSHLN